MTASKAQAILAVQALKAKARPLRDIERGDGVKFSCAKTGVEYKIISYKGDGLSSPKSCAVERDTDDGFMYRSFINLTSMYGGGLQKKKHYYFYSKKGGYGKSTFIRHFCSVTNSAVIRDLNNFTDVPEDAQFLLVDEYGPNRRFDIDELKGLTGGTGIGFTGNCKASGASFVPRSDVQLIIVSNKHLFDCMGSMNSKTNTRKVSAADADLLNQRFTIYRMDESSILGRTEERDAKRYTEEYDPEEGEDDEDGEEGVLA